MELVMLKNVCRKSILAGIDAKKQQRKEEEGNVNVVIYDPSPMEGIVDNAISAKLAELREVEIKKTKTEELEKKKFMNAVTFTDIPATIKKAGFHPDGSPKLAIAGLFDGDVRFIVRSKQAKYRSDSLTVILADVKNDWKNLIVFFVGLAGVIASFFISINTPFEDLDFYSSIILIIVSLFIPLIALLFVAVPTSPKFGSYFTYLELPNIGKVRTRSNFYTKVPPVPENVLTAITGPGPFAILFDVTQGWKKIAPDPIIFRIISINGQQFFEPVVGYDMTPLEKKSLTEA